ncbi:Protein AF-10 [Holothuria leucospilota]|uniref:Protein AF-10 n=1 Tax=Holothuria leucospilota TaxID=206669 RepID=A0A9Q0YSC4_HOLLE|nr:Protein AF-10 [Holothuria leucospilota]
MKEMVGGCCVCGDERGWTENPLVYCDGHGCNVAVHQACYGIVSVPTGPWYCRKCESQERAARVRCELCPQKEGALKRTDNGGWAHVVCALYIPEVRFGNVTSMEPILLSIVPHDRYNKVCFLCETKGRESKATTGACMTCNRNGCKQSFHVTCAQSEGLLCEESGHYTDNVKYTGYCTHHYQKLRKDRDIKTIPPFRPLGSNYSTPEKDPSEKQDRSKAEKVRTKAEKRPRMQALPPVTPADPSPAPSQSEEPKELLEEVEEDEEDDVDVEGKDGDKEEIGKDSSNISSSSSSHSSKFTNANFKVTTITSGVGGAATGGDGSLLSKLRKTSGKEKRTGKGSLKGPGDGTDSAANSPKSVGSPKSIGDTELKELKDKPFSKPSSPAVEVEQRATPEQPPERPKRMSSREASRTSTPVPSRTPTPASTTAVVLTENLTIKDLPPVTSSSVLGVEVENVTDNEGVTTPSEIVMNKPLDSTSRVPDPESGSKTDATEIATQPDSPDMPMPELKVGKHERRKHKKQAKGARGRRKTRDQDEPPMKKKRRRPSGQGRGYASLSCGPSHYGGAVQMYSMSAEESAIQDVFNTAGQSGHLSGPPRPSQYRSFFDKKSENPMPTTMEALLEKQWDQGADFLMNQASSSHLDIASLLSCLHQIREENLRLEQHISNLLQRRDHLVTVNTRLALPLTHNSLHNAQLGMAGGGDGNARSRSPRYNNVMHTQNNDLNSSHNSSHSSLNQSGHSVHSHQSLNQSFNSSYNSPSSNHHQGHNASSHSLARNHAASPSTSSSNLYHTHYAPSSNQNHSSGAAPTSATALQNSVSHQERRRNATSPYVNSVTSSSVHGQHGGINQVKGGDRTTSSSNYRQYAGGVHSSTDSHAVKSSHLTTDQHHRLYSQSKQATAQSTATTLSSTHAHGSSQVTSSRAGQGSSQNRKAASHGRPAATTHGDKNVGGLIPKSESDQRIDMSRQVPVATPSMQNQTVIPLTVLTPHQQISTAILPPNMTPQQHHLFQMMLPHTVQGEASKSKMMVNLSSTEGVKGQQAPRSKSPRNDKKQNGADKNHQS